MHKSGLKISFCSSSALLFCSVLFSIHVFWDFYLSTVVVNVSLMIKAVGFEIITGLLELGSVVKNTKYLLWCCCHWVNWNLNVRTGLVVIVALYVILKYDINSRQATCETWDTWVNFFLPLFLGTYKWIACVLPAFTINSPSRKENSLLFTL